MTHFIRLMGLSTYANTGESILSPNSQEKMVKQMSSGLPESPKMVKKESLSKEEELVCQDEKKKLGRILAKEKRTREARQHARDNLVRNAVQIRQAEEKYLPTPNKNYSNIFIGGAPTRIRQNERAGIRSSDRKNIRVFWQSKWQGHGTDFH